jgi:hypothetical protein
MWATTATGITTTIGTTHEAETNIGGGISAGTTTKKAGTGTTIKNTNANTNDRLYNQHKSIIQSITNIIYEYFKLQTQRTASPPQHHHQATVPIPHTQKNIYRSQ